MGDPKCYFPDRHWDEEYNYDPDEGPLTLSCRYCGEAYLHWEATEEIRANVFSRWRLFDSARRLHTCKKYKKKTMGESPKFRVNCN